MKTINVLSYIGLTILGVCLLIIFGALCAQKGIGESLAYSIGYLIGYCAVMIPIMALNLKIVHFFLLRKKENEIEALIDRVSELENKG